MQINVSNKCPSIAGAKPVMPRYEDPLDHDMIGDALVITNRRSLLRVALVAAETASRFAPEQMDADPMAWMLSPRRLFDGCSTGKRQSTAA